MNKLKEAYKILKDIPKGSDTNTYYQKAKEAFETSNACLEAVVLLNYFESNIDNKINNYKKVIEYIESSNSKDVNYKDNLLKAKEALVPLLIESEQYNNALEVLETLDDNYSDVKFKKTSLYAYFDDEKIVEHYHAYIDSCIDYGYICLAFPYMVYQFKHQNFEDVKQIFTKIVDINEDILKVLKGEIKESDEPSDLTRAATTVLANNSFLINTTPGLIESLITLC